MELKLELVIVPVSNVDRSKAFYIEQAGFHLDVDHVAGEHFRVVQLTPPGSACSISIGVGLGDAVPGSVKGLHLVTPDIVATRAELVQRGMAISEIFHFDNGQQKPGIDPELRAYNSFMSFRDPDGNEWQIQHVNRGA